MDDLQRLRYSRHLLLEGWTESAQDRLLQSHAAVIGVGGLGSTAALHLAAAGVGQISLWDPDVVELSNLQRQIIHTTASLGEPKVSSAEHTLRAVNPGTVVHPHVQRIDEPILTTWLDAQRQHQAHQTLVVLDCTDRASTRHAINRACWQARVAWVSAAVVQWDAHVTAFDPGQATSPCYACWMPEPIEQDLDTPCATLGVMGALAGVAGAVQAAEALKGLMGWWHEDATHTSLVGRLRCWDARNWQSTEWRIRRRPDCPVCGASCGAR